MAAAVAAAARAVKAVGGGDSRAPHAGGHTPKTAETKAEEAPDEEDDEVLDVSGEWSEAAAALRPKGGPPANSIADELPDSAEPESKPVADKPLTPPRTKRAGPEGGFDAEAAELLASPSKPLDEEARKELAALIATDNA